MSNYINFEKGQTFSDTFINFIINQGKTKLFFFISDLKKKKKLENINVKVLIGHVFEILFVTQWLA